MTWLLKRIQAKSHDENRAYATELLSILLQNRNENRLVLSENDGIEIILKVLSVIRFQINGKPSCLIILFQQFRRRDPLDTEETEFMENLFDALCSALSEQKAKQLFLDAEGPDLMILMIKSVFECQVNILTLIVRSDRSLSRNHDPSKSSIMLCLGRLALPFAKLLSKHLV